MISNERLKEIIRRYADFDFESYGTEYVRFVLNDICGCTDEEIEEIGLGWLLPT